MEILKDLSKEEYNDYRSCLKFLKENKTIGNEDADYNGIFHVHWRRPIDNDKVILQIKSTLATQKVNKIYFWIEDELVTKGFPPNKLSLGYSKLLQFKDYVEFKVFDKNYFWLEILLDGFFLKFCFVSEFIRLYTPLSDIWRFIKNLYIRKVVFNQINKIYDISKLKKFMEMLSVINFIKKEIVISKTINNQSKTIIMRNNVIIDFMDIKKGDELNIHAWNWIVTSDLSLIQNGLYEVDIIAKLSKRSIYETE